MNINSMKGILGDAVSNEVRTLELRVGQVVRGVVLQQFPNNEATVSINGVQVRAKLEIPLMEGQASLLQVQPDSKGGQVHLKQVDPATLGLQDPMKDIMKALSLPDKAWAQELIKDLRQEGFALNKETAAAFQRAAQLQPDGISQEQWMNAAAAAFKRGLPMTEATISAMHQLQNGTPLHSLITQLRGQLVQMLANNNNPQFHQLLSQLSAQLEQGTDLLRFLSNEAGNTNNYQPTQTTQAAAQSGQAALQNGTAQTPVAQFSASPSAGTAAAMTNGSNQTASAQTASTMQDGAGQPASSASSANQAAAQGNATGLTTQQLLPQLIKWLGVNYESLLAKQLLSQSGQEASQANSANQTLQTQQGSSVGNAASAFTAANNAQANTMTSGTQAQQASNQTAQTAQSPAPSNLSQAQPQPTSFTQNAGQTPAAQASPLSNTSMAANQAATAQPLHGGVTEGTATAGNLATANANSANAAVQQGKQAAQGNAVLPASPSSAQAAGLQQAASLAAAAEGTHIQAAAHSASGQMTHESLKATIMQLLQSPDLPSGLKDTAQQLLHAITGQQLMLSPERNHSVFSHVTLFIPFQDGEGGQTASVHVQTRRNRKGELDSDNCRIVFDLQMKTLGPTLVDMNIVNKIVSLNLWNDHPAISPIVNTLKPDVLAALQNHGYMLSSIKATPIPLKEEQPAKLEEGKVALSPPDIEQLNSTRYKGVDFKV